MTDMLHSPEAPMAPATLVWTTHTEPSATERATRTRREDHVLRLYAVPGKHGGFTARRRSGTLVIACDGYVLAACANTRRILDRTERRDPRSPAPGTTVPTSVAGRSTEMPQVRVRADGPKGGTS
jgi:hypothetical protein